MREGGAYCCPPTLRIGCIQFAERNGRKTLDPGWPLDGKTPWSGHYVLDANGAPLSVGWDWAARSLEFTAPNPLIRPTYRGVRAPIPTIADAEKGRKPSGRIRTRILRRGNRGKTRINPPLPGPRLFRKRPESVCWYLCPMSLDDLVAGTSARVRLDKHTHEPVRHIPKSNSPENPISGSTQLYQWTSKSKGEKSPPDEPIRGGHRIIFSQEPKIAPKGKKSRRKDWTECMVGRIWI